MLIKLLQLFHSEGYCFYLDYLHIFYYPETNIHHVYPPEIKRNIEDLSEQEARNMTGLSKFQLRKLYVHLFIPDIIYYRCKHTFMGEECLLHYLLFNQLGETKLRMSEHYFGGDPR